MLEGGFLILSTQIYAIRFSQGAYYSAEQPCFVSLITPLLGIFLTEGSRLQEIVLSSVRLMSPKRGKAAMSRDDLGN